MSSAIIAGNVSDRSVGQVLPWLLEQPAPKFQIVPYDPKMSLARKSIVITFLKSQKKSAWNPFNWLFPWRRTEEQVRLENLETFTVSFTSHKYLIISRENINQVLSIIERIFGPLASNPSDRYLQELREDEIFNALENFYEYSASFNEIQPGKVERIIKHLASFQFSASAALPSINFLSLQILNRQMKHWHDNATLGNLAFQIYRTTLERSNNQFVREESCRGLQILNRNPLYIRVSITFGNTFKHLPDIATAIAAIVKIAILFLGKSPHSTPALPLEGVLV